MGQMEHTKNTREAYMRQALQIAKQGEGWVSPNPMVGCVVAKDGEIIATGFHERYGGFHAERNALLHCSRNAEGADLYVTLEPCCHYGKTPPCTEIIIEKKIKNVYVGCLDPNPKVAGNGVRILREHGISVETGILEQECRKLNEVFFHFMEHKTPFAAMKYAMTLDGKIACETGDSKWITGEEARGFVQRLRHRYRGIMAGIGTVLADDPMLNCRMAGGRDPVRIICDSRLRLPKDSQIAATASQIETIAAWNREEALRWRAQQALQDPAAGFRTSGNYPEQATRQLDADRQALEGLGVSLLEIPVQGNGNTKQLDLTILFRELAKRGIDSILIEGGGTLNASALQSRLIQRVYAFLAPKLIAGANAKSPIEGQGIPKMADAILLDQIETTQYGRDFCITGRISTPPEKEP